MSTKEPCGGGANVTSLPPTFSLEGVMVREDDVVAIFHSIHRVMQAEKVLKQAGAEILLIPVPRQLASDCGLAIRYAAGAQLTVAEILRREGLQPAEVYRREGEGYRRLDAD
jgi:hypothetical protein